MSLKNISIIVLYLSYNLSIAQTYFNNRYDLFTKADASADVFMKDSSYFVSCGGLDITVSNLSLSIIKLNKFGVITNAKHYFKNNNWFYTGLGNSTCLLNDSVLVSTGYRVGSGTSKSFIIWYKNNLDSIRYLEYGFVNRENVVYNILNDNIGHFYQVGYVDSSNTNTDILLIKTDTSGNEIWKKKIGLPNYDETAWCIKTSSDGKLLISGNRRLHNNQSTNGAFVIKADTSGAIIWEKYFPSNYGLAATGMVELGNGDIVALAGKGFGSTISRYELIKLDATGNILFDKVYGPMADRAEAYSLIQNQEGNLVAAGQIYYSANNSVNGLMYVFNQNGDSLFSREYAVQSGSQNYFRDLVQAPDKGYVFSGFISPLFANGGTGNQDIWLLKTDSTFCEAAFNCGYPTSIAEAEALEAGEMNLMPNPTNGLLNISSKNDFEKIELLSLTGQVLLTETVSEKHLPITIGIQLQNFADGIYYVRVIYSNGMSVTKKVVKQ